MDDKSPERQMREQTKGKDGRYLPYSTCEKCGRRRSVGLTCIGREGDGTVIWEGYACKLCRKAIRAEAEILGGTLEE